MSEKTDVILVKASWCGHCKIFEPIFDNTEKYMRKNAFFKKKNVNLKSFDFGDENIKREFENEYGKVTQYIDGYPTVLVRYETKNNVKYTLVNTTQQDESVKENHRLNSATEKFVENIKNGYDSLLVQTGGNFEYKLEKNLENLLSKTYYKKKYLEYKAKYVKLKNKI